MAQVGLIIAGALILLLMGIVYLASPAFPADLQDLGRLVGL